MWLISLFESLFKNIVKSKMLFFDLFSNMKLKSIGNCVYGWIIYVYGYGKYVYGFFIR